MGIARRDREAGSLPGQVDFSKGAGQVSPVHGEGNGGTLENTLSWRHERPRFMLFPNPRIDLCCQKPAWPPPNLVRVHGGCTIFGMGGLLMGILEQRDTDARPRLGTRCGRQDTAGAHAAPSSFADDQARAVLEIRGGGQLWARRVVSMDWQNFDRKL